MSAKIEQPAFLPESMLTHITTEARRMDRSLSWCVQTAWVHARGELSKLAHQSEHPAAEAQYQRYEGQEKRKQTLSFPSAMLDEIRGEAARQDRSISWLVQRAWCLASAHVAALPTAEADTETE
jgi:uncharacterized small protein (TIGR04563 family)